MDNDGNDNTIGNRLGNSIVGTDKEHRYSELSSYRVQKGTFFIQIFIVGVIINDWKIDRSKCNSWNETRIPSQYRA